MYELDTGHITGMHVKLYENRQTISRENITRGGHKIIKCMKKYIIISPESTTNCFYHCMAYYNLLLKGEYDKMMINKTIVQMAKDYKK